MDNRRANRPYCGVSISLLLGTTNKLAECTAENVYGACFNDGEWTVFDGHREVFSIRTKTHGRNAAQNRVKFRIGNFRRKSPDGTVPLTLPYHGGNAVLKP